MTVAGVHLIHVRKGPGQNALADSSLGDQEADLNRSASGPWTGVTMKSHQGVRDSGMNQSGLDVGLVHLGHGPGERHPSMGCGAPLVPH